MEFEPVIGFEFHAQLKTKTKFFFVLNVVWGLARHITVIDY